MDLRIIGWHAVIAGQMRRAYNRMLINGNLRELNSCQDVKNRLPNE